jgi:hypothetical protein
MNQPFIPRKPIHHLPVFPVKVGIQVTEHKTFRQSKASPRLSWVEQTPPASILASGIGVLSISTWLEQISRVALIVVYGGDEVGSKRPATNSPGIAVDSNQFDCLAEKSGLNVDPRRLASPTEQGESRYV